MDDSEEDALFTGNSYDDFRVPSPYPDSRPPSRLPYIRIQSTFPSADADDPSFNPEIDPPLNSRPGTPGRQRELQSPAENSTREPQRQPIDYNSIQRSTGEERLNNSFSSAMLSRYKYYNKLGPALLTMPSHVASIFLITTPAKPSVTQSSLVTILSMCNTMMGTSLLSIPWALNQAGFASGVILLLMMGAIMCYTCKLILYSAKHFELRGTIVEFTDICRYYLGRWAEYLALFSGLLSFLGGIIVYWILLSNFLYNIVSFVYYHASEESESEVKHTGDPICPHGSSNGSQTSSSNFTGDADFEKYWDERKTTPFILILLLFPIANIKSPTFFTKFNSMGTLSVTYLIGFALKNVISWGINVDFRNPDSKVFTPEFKGTFPSLTGVAAFGFFVQNSLLSITRTQKCPEKNMRDLLVAYIIVSSIYLFVGLAVYLSFDLDKNCLEDNFLNNLKKTSIMAFVARIGLFFQITCVFPLLTYIFRVQFMNTFLGSTWPSFVHVLGLNVILIAICVLFAVFLPHIGHIIGLFGAFSGFTYAILLPCMVYLKIQHKKGKLRKRSIAFHSVLIVIGFFNLIGQFLQII